MNPAHKSLTLRRRIEEILENGPATIRDISRLAGMSEKDVSSHLPHVDKSLAARGRKLAISPYSCINCGFAFQSKKRFKKPGRCPKCKCERMEEAVFQIEG
ncbi:MAG: ArsR family transcriptional regulator [Desulfatibacillaceae bacterium]|nr:ArsR family transcriptional regulator [Desulfatibacillaceae bacterium]